MHIKMSPEIDKLAPALVKAVAKIKPVVKGSANPQFRSKYADLSSCLEEAGEALAGEGLCVMQPPVTHLPAKHDDQSADPVVMLATIIMHESGQWMAGEIALPHLEAGKFPMAQAIGSAITYLRRYSLCAMLSIPTEDDDGEAAMGRGGSGGYAHRDDRRPASNGSGRQYTQAPHPADRIASQAASQPAARPRRVEDAPVDESFGEPPYRGR